MREHAFVPRYRELFDALCRKIRARYWKYGEKLPSQEELCREYSVSCITVKTAIRHLQQGGYVRSIRHKGTFVCWKKEQEYYASSMPSGKRNVEIIHSLLVPTPAYSYIMNILADVFMEKNPQVSIRFREVLPRGAEDPYLQLLDAGDMPTCGEFFWHAAYARRDALYPLEQFPDFEEVAQELHPYAFYPTNDSRNESHIHALYIFLGIPMFLMANAGLTEQAGAQMPLQHLTWAQIHRLTRVLAKSRVFDTRYTSAFNEPCSYHNVKPFIELMGQDFFNRGGSVMDLESFRKIFDCESAVFGLEHIRRMIQTGSTLLQKGAEHFALGDVGFMLFSTQWSLALIEMLNRDLRYWISPVPPIGKNKKYYSFHSGFSVGIFRNGIASDLQLQMSWEWIKFFFHSRSQYLLSQDFTLPVRNGAEAYLQKKAPMLNVLAGNMLKKSIPQPDFIAMRQAFAAAGRPLAQFLHEDISPENCLKNIRESLDRIFS